MNYLNPYQQNMMSNAYSPYQAYQPQAPMINYNRNELNGKTVADFNEITANDVPMNGSIAIFPKNDLSEIEARQWNSNGTISKIVFKPILEDNPSKSIGELEKGSYEALKSLYEDINGKLDELSVAVSKLSSQKTRNVAKKEADE